MTYANDVPASDKTTERAAMLEPGKGAATTRTNPAALAAELRVALMRSVRKIRQQRSSEVITDGQYSVLACLDARGPLTMRELADIDHVQPPSMSRTVNALVEAGLVGRAGHPDDGRQVLVSLTSAGAQEVKETRRRRDAWLARRLAELEPAEREVLAEAAQILRRVIAP